jgi:hypothetical protein
VFRCNCRISLVSSAKRRLPRHGRDGDNGHGADDSNGESHWGFPEEFRDHESYEPVDQITTIQRNDEGNEYGDDEGKLPPFLYYHLGMADYSLG